MQSMLQCYGIHKLRILCVYVKNTHTQSYLPTQHHIHLVPINL